MLEGCGVSSGSRSQCNRLDIGGEGEAPRSNLVQKGCRQAGTWSVQKLVQGSIGYPLLSTCLAHPTDLEEPDQRWKEEPSELLVPPL